jgi:hypothetical protein
MHTQLTLEQFANFVSGVWNSKKYKEWADPDKIWLGIAEQEFSRTFQNGFGYCVSKLEFCTDCGRTWVYRTTSDTVLSVSQDVWEDVYTGELPPIEIWVEIPEAREQGYHAHLLANALAGIDNLESIQVIKTETNSSNLPTPILDDDWEEYDGATDYDYDEEYLTYDGLRMPADMVAMLSTTPSISDKDSEKYDGQVDFIGEHLGVYFSK